MSRQWRFFPQTLRKHRVYNASCISQCRTKNQINCLHHRCKNFIHKVTIACNASFVLVLSLYCPCIVLVLSLYCPCIVPVGISVQALAFQYASIFASVSYHLAFFFLFIIYCLLLYILPNCFFPSFILYVVNKCEVEMNLNWMRWRHHNWML